MYTYSHFILLCIVEQLYPNIFLKAYTYPDVIIRFRNFYLIGSGKSGTIFKWIISMIYICYLKKKKYIYSSFSFTENSLENRKTGWRKYLKMLLKIYTEEGMRHWGWGVRDRRATDGGHAELGVYEFYFISRAGPFNWKTHCLPNILSSDVFFNTRQGGRPLY